MREGKERKSGHGRVWEVKGRVWLKEGRAGRGGKGRRERIREFDVSQSLLFDLLVKIIEIKKNRKNNKVFFFFYRL